MAKKLLPTINDDEVSEEFPANSTGIEKRKKKIRSVVTKPIKIRKPGILDNLSETFFGDSAANVFEYLIKDILIPSGKNILQDMVTTGIDLLLFGSSDNRPTRNRSQRGLIPYGTFYSGSRRSERYSSNRSRLPQRQHKAVNRVNGIILDDRREAEIVLASMRDELARYQQVTVSEFYEFIGMEEQIDFTDNRYGWEDLDDAFVRRTSGGWTIVFPTPIRID